jgi:crotonobetainyl-CoA:carnitine CoA-transferase CaiB-like acyl-CoA transferase
VVAVSVPIGGILNGVVVVDLSRHIAGPLCTQLLGDLGATVIKVEGLRGDDSRVEEPLYRGTSLYYMNYNRSKRSISVDFRSPEASEILEPLISRADILVQNFRPGVMAKMGLSETRIRELSADIIYVSVSGFGSRGPNAHLPAFDEVLQAMSGLMSLTGARDGAPTLIGVPIIDNLTGVYAFASSLAALYHRRTTGRGQTIDVNLLGAALTVVNPSITRFYADGVEESRNGNRNRYVAGINTYETQDGFIESVSYSDAHWAKLVERIGKPDLAQDARYSTIESRAQHVDEVDAILSDWMAGFTNREILAVMEADGIPCGAVRSVGEVARDPELRLAERLVDLLHPTGEELPFLRMPVEFSLTPAEVELPPPQLGEHTTWVLREFLGMSAAQAEALIDRGVARRLDNPAVVEEA